MAQMNQLISGMRGAVLASDVGSKLEDFGPYQGTSVADLIDRRGLTERVFLACQEASVRGWDGYDADPVRFGSYELAIRLVNDLPRPFLDADVSIDPDGEVAFEWRYAPGWLLSISIGDSGILTYAGSWGESKAHGRERIYESIPRVIDEALGRLEGGRQAARE